MTRTPPRRASTPIFTIRYRTPFRRPAKRLCPPLPFERAAASRCDRAAAGRQSRCAGHTNSTWRSIRPRICSTATALRPPVRRLQRQPDRLVFYGGTFDIQSPNAANIGSVVLVRPGAPTHAFDMEQRLIELTFTTGAGVLTATAPPDGNIAPPGYYMLFLLNSSGVPSVATSFADDRARQSGPDRVDRLSGGNVRSILATRSRSPAAAPILRTIARTHGRSRAAHQRRAPPRLRAT